MDEQAITRAAEEAMNDLQLDCKINNVCRSQGGDEWCVQFSGKYGQFCDDFKNQFGKENSSRVVQEKIKSYLLKQVTKIRSSTGKSRRPKANATDQRSPQSPSMSAPLEMIGEVFSRASEVAGAVVQQAAGVADAARETVANMAESISPVTVEIRSDSRAERKRPYTTQSRKKVKAAKSTSNKTTKKARSVSRSNAGKQAKKAGKAASKAGGKSKKQGATRIKKRKQKAEGGRRKAESRRQ